MAQSVESGTLAIHISEIPEFLHKSAFYLSLAQNGDNSDAIEVPSNCFCTALDVNNHEDLLRVLSTMRFWGFDSLPDEVISYCLEHFTVDLIEMCREFEHELVSLRLLLDICAKSANWRVKEALRKGCLDLVRYFHRLGQDLGDDPIDDAIMYGHTQVIQYLYENGFPITFRSVNMAGAAGQLGCLRYFAEHCPEKQKLFAQSDRACYAVSVGGHAACLQFLHEQGAPWGQDVCGAAAEGGHLECLRYAHEHGCSWDRPNITCVAAGHNQFPCFRYLVEQGCPMGDRVCEHIGSCGNLEMLQYAHQHGCRLTQVGLLRAAEHGHLAVFQYVVENLVQTGDELQAAVLGKHVELALYILSVGGRATPEAWRYALVNRMKSVLDKICERRALWPGRECQGDYIYFQIALPPWSHHRMEMSPAVAGGCLHCAQSLHNQGYHWSKTIYRFGAQGDSFHTFTPMEYASYLAYNGFLDCLQFAHANGCNWDKRTCTAAALGGHIEVLQWAHEQGCSWDAEETAQAAAVGGNAECIAYCAENGLPVLKLRKLVA